MLGPEIVIVTPALASANNGNWRTARRWARMLSGHYRVQVTENWSGGDEVAMIALHARRSAAAVAAWRRLRGAAPLAVVLTGTDLYRDIDHSAEARRSLDLADRLVVLQELGARRLAPPLQAKARVCVQSSPARVTLDKPQRQLRALMVGHLREEKSPATYFEAARLLAGRSDIRLDHVGDGLDPALAAQARELAAACPHYRWLGALPHEATRRRIQRAHVLVHPSRMEGGAHVIIEAVTSGTPVLASRVDGNVGLLGADYPGYFPWGDAAALAALLQRCRDEPAMLARLGERCATLAPRFEPEQERRTLLDLMNELLESPR